ncbi:MAG: hypothetical protein MJ066_01855 [Clostridia bacterium]|nr:hypothetical protein [Clostridia bacterium]
MNLQDVKEVFNFALDYGNRKFSDFQKEIIKKAFDKSKSIQEIVCIVCATWNWDK